MKRVRVKQGVNLDCAEWDKSFGRLKRISFSDPNSTSSTTAATFLGIESKLRGV